MYLIRLLIKMIRLIEFGVLDDIFPPRLHFIAHENGDQGIGFGSILNGHLHQLSMCGIHGGIPQLLRVHFAKALIPLQGIAPQALDGLFQFLIIIGIADIPALFHGVQGGHTDIHMPVCYQLPHVTIEEGE